MKFRRPLVEVPVAAALAAVFVWSIWLSFGAVVVQTLPTIDVRDLGARADDGIDDSNALRLAAALAGAGGGGRTIVLPAGTLDFSGTPVLLPSNATVVGQGRGATTLRVPAGRSTPVFDVDGKSNVRLSDFAITKAAGADAAGTAYGIWVRGASSGVLIERVTTGGATLPASGVRGDGLVNGVRVAGNEGTVAGTVTNLTLRDVECNNSPASWGIHLAHCLSPVVDSCRGQGNLLDGLKVYQKCFNTRILGGEFSDNGQGYTIDPLVYAGDGFDAFGGGDTLTVIGTVCKRNRGNGATIKTGDTTNFPAGTWGFIRRITVRDVDFSDNLVAAGLYLNLNDPSDTTEPLPNRASVTGVFDGNAQDGVIVNARNVVVGPGTMARGNGRYGIGVGSRAFDVDLHGVTAVANTSYNLEIGGATVRVFGGTFYGADADTVATQANQAALTPVSPNCIHVATTAADVHLYHPKVGFQSDTFVPIKVDMTSGVCQIHREGASSPFAVAMPGGVGSTWTRNDAGGLGISQFIKTSAPNLTTGWVRTTPLLVSNASVGTTQTTIAHSCGYAPSVIVIKPKGNATVWQSQAADATNVYLTASTAITVDLSVQ
jgi:hypothetical protein